MDNKHLLRRQHHLGIINKITRYITEHLDEDLSLKSLSNIAAFSPFHFHRLFASVWGETLHDFVTRKRLEKIAESILMLEKPALNELCMRFGFDSPSSFSRAFKHHYGISPTEMRKKRKGRFSKIVREKTFSGEDSITIKHYIDCLEESINWLMANGKVEVQKLQRMKLASITNQGPFVEVYDVFGRLRHWAERKGVVNPDSRWLMVIHDNPAVTEESKIMQSACLELITDIELDGEIVPLEIPEGYYLTGHFKLSEDLDFKRAWDGMSIWLVDNNYQPRNGYYFEMFRNDGIFSPNEKQVDICLPINKYRTETLPTV